jgi:copper resistance protein B
MSAPRLLVIALVTLTLPVLADAQQTQAGHEEHSAHAPQAQAPLPSSIPPVTDADRAAAFPDVDGHGVHDAALNYFVLLDQLEWQGTGGGSRGSWDTRGWIGGDVTRFWFRTEGEATGSRVASTQTHVLYGRAISRWWDVVAGVRQDVRPGPAQTWAAVGVQGIAPYWFELQATAYVGASGRTHLRVEGEYELLVTNRLIVQPLVETEVYGKADPEHGFGAGLATLDAGLRVRYEIRREFAPYVGVVWSRKFFGTGDLAEAAGEPRAGARLALGVRIWF